MKQIKYEKKEFCKAQTVIRYSTLQTILSPILNLENM